MKKRWICTLLVFAMVASLLSGCGKKKGGNTSIVKYDPSERVTLTVGIPQRASISSYKDNALTKYIEESLNMDLEFEYFSSKSSEYANQLSLMCSSNNETLPDVLWGFNELGRTNWHSYGEEGYLIDLTDYIEEYAPDYLEHLNALSDKDKARIVNAGTSEDGAFYSMPMLTTDACDNLGDLIYINQTWLDKLGKSVPTTPDELYDVLKAFATQDPNGNGKADEIGMFGNVSATTHFVTYVINSFVYYDNKQPFDVSDGKVWPVATTDEYRQALIFLNKLCKEGLLSDLSFSIKDRTEASQIITPAEGHAQVGIWGGHPLLYTSADATILDEYVALPYMKGVTDKGGYTVKNPTALYWCGGITKDCKNPGAAMTFLNFFYKDETVTRMRHGEKDVDWVVGEGENQNGDPSTIKALNAEAFTTGSSTWGMNSCCIMTPENYLEIIEPGEGRQQQVNRLTKESAQFLTNGKYPEYTAHGLNYTTEEEEVRDEKYTLYKQNMVEQRNLFITGKQDPSNDAVWDDYCMTMESYGQKELTDIIQNAYNRTVKK